MLLNIEVLKGRQEVVLVERVEGTYIKRTSVECAKIKLLRIY